MSEYVVVQRFENEVHVNFLTKDQSIVSVSIYGFNVNLFSDEKLISLAKDELRRKTDSEIFCLVNVTRKVAQQAFDFVTPRH
jgi:hypothetical protein